MMPDLMRATPRADDAPKVHRVLNLGAGTQSSVLYLMMCRGELPPAEVAIFADTQWEPKSVYTFLQWLKAEGKGIVPIVEVTAGNLRNDVIEFRSGEVQYGVKNGGKRYASIPLYVLNPDGSSAITKRQCTSEYKIAPIERYIKREILRLAKGQRVPPDVIIEQIFGISFDERQRMRAPDAKWKRFSYPLVDMKWRRQQVIDWAERHYPGVTFPRSACIGCPYRSDAEWRNLTPEELEDAIRFDEEIRVADKSGRKKIRGLRGTLYIHRKLKPLSEVDFGDDATLWDGVRDNECTGMCGT